MVIKELMIPLVLRLCRGVMSAENSLDFPFPDLTFQ